MRVSSRTITSLSKLKISALSPLDQLQKNEGVNVTIDDQKFERVNLSHQNQFQRTSKGVWAHGNFDLSTEKHHRASGPISNLFFNGLILVPGTVGTEEETFFNKWVAENAVGYYRSRNGGVHRGGIMGDNAVQLPVILDVELTEDLLQTNNLLLYGTYDSNAILSQFEGELPLSFQGETIHPIR